MLDSVSPQLIAAVVTQPSWSVADLASSGHIIVAVEIGDPGNLGAMIRTAEASGAAGMIVAGSSVDRFNPKVMRASAGSILRVPILDVANADGTASLAGEVGRSLVATEVTGSAAPYDSVDLTDAMIMVGNEPRGLDVGYQEIASEVVTIPTEPAVESLNVAAAAAVLAFEAARQARNSRLSEPG